LWLVKNGVPWSEAFELDQAEVMAFCVTFGEFEGGEFDWSSMQWRKKDP